MEGSSICPLGRDDHFCHLWWAIKTLVFDRDLAVLWMDGYTLKSIELPLIMHAFQQIFSLGDSIHAMMLAMVFVVGDLIAHCAPWYSEGLNSQYRLIPQSFN
jgi:hypothetical protein